MSTIQTKDLVSLFGAVILGFVFFLLSNYLSLFGVVTVDSDLVVISVGVLIGYGAARLSDAR
ncbi:hypothetical protein E6P09_16430 (plasmid) [Haloferax mediterranei ATCC 33500]|uniref:Uncharacterized protein n=1 Tax=Haloferax mediterranei (strain ATCC 33500 / DSM 1411 / JCM 8866 / NBRC 14739 / NCIMB 2177 / R-4) TaxID=523841 RepID=I3RB09_HALMT|nr:hypothetical protein HFX_6297 [Haloferax mediterranei ATCC 33500]AHZ24511.1 hypothetical protein BM92_16510 [Haloferax mediterranei ATCC 33500]ELZ97263.1 hypothetical protein C439_18113 [Haloferax mediterranei ATCC 33500]QCQ76908.1 hypothetical protein E6P09_16430 [Haloferax mediterranei ATCC 33500]